MYEKLLPGGMVNGMMGASAQQHHMQRIQQGGGNLFGGNAANMQQQQQVNGMQVPLLLPVAQTTTAIPVATTPDYSEIAG